MMKPGDEKRLRGGFLIDTNVLIYATLEADQRFAPAREVIEARLKGNNRAFVSAQNLSEMYPNLTGPKTKPPDSPEAARKKIEAIAGLHRLTILPVTREVVERALELCQEYGVSRQRYFDMQLIAAMQIAGINTVVTENTSDFDGVEGLVVVNPFAPEPSETR
jgi:predicted nucleic acid-binding protein